MSVVLFLRTYLLLMSYVTIKSVSVSSKFRTIFFFKGAFKGSSIFISQSMI